MTLVFKGVIMTLLVPLVLLAMITSIIIIVPQMDITAQHGELVMDG